MEARKEIRERQKKREPRDSADRGRRGGGVQEKE